MVRAVACYRLVLMDRGTSLPLSLLSRDFFTIFIPHCCDFITCYIFTSPNLSSRSDPNEYNECVIGSGEEEGEWGERVGGVIHSRLQGSMNAVLH